MEELGDISRSLKSKPSIASRSSIVDFFRNIGKKIFQELALVIETVTDFFGSDISESIKVIIVQSILGKTDFGSGKECSGHCDSGACGYW